MKRILLILSLLIMVFAPVSCFYMDDAKTVNLDDKTYINPAVPPGIALTAIVPQVLNAPSLTNPYITISFNMPVDPNTIDFETLFIVEFPIGTQCTEGTNYDATIYAPEGGVLKIYLKLDVDELNLTVGETIRIVLTGLKTDTDPPMTLYSPKITIDVTVQN